MMTTQDKYYYVLLGVLLTLSLVSIAISAYYLAHHYARKRLAALQKKHISALLGVASPETIKYLAKKDKNARF
jgi:hypothetical protein